MDSRKLAALGAALTLGAGIGACGGRENAQKGNQGVQDAPGSHSTVQQPTPALTSTGATTPPVTQTTNTGP